MAVKTNIINVINNLFKKFRKSKPIIISNNNNLYFKIGDFFIKISNFNLENGVFIFDLYYKFKLDKYNCQCSKNNECCNNNNSNCICKNSGCNCECNIKEKFDVYNSYFDLLFNENIVVDYNDSNNIFYVYDKNNFAVFIINLYNFFKNYFDKDLSNIETLGEIIKKLFVKKTKNIKFLRVTLHNNKQFAKIYCKTNKTEIIWEL